METAIDDINSDGVKCVEHLWTTAHEYATVCPALSRHLMVAMSRRASQRGVYHTTVLAPKVKQCFCSFCGSIFIGGYNCHVRVSNGKSRKKKAKGPTIDNKPKTKIIDNNTTPDIIQASNTTIKHSGENENEKDKERDGKFNLKNPNSLGAIPKGSKCAVVSIECNGCKRITILDGGPQREKASKDKKILAVKKKTTPSLISPGSTNDKANINTNVTMKMHGKIPVPVSCGGAMKRALVSPKVESGKSCRNKKKKLDLKGMLAQQKKDKEARSGMGRLSDFLGTL